MFTAKRKELIEKMVKKGFDYVSVTNINFTASPT